MGDRQRQVGVLFHQENRQAALFVDLDDLVKDGAHEHGGDAEGGLVQHEALGLAHEGPGDGEHLLFTTGKGAGELGDALLEPGEHGEGVVHVLLDAGFIPTEVGAHPEVLLHGQVGEDHAAFRHMAEALGDHGVRGLVGDFLPVILHLTATGADEPGDGAEGGGLACAVGPDERDDGLLRHLQGHPVQSLDRSVGDFELVDFKHRAGPFHPRCPSRRR